MYYVEKRFEHAFSTCFRQHNAKSHCRFLHGYALTVSITFKADVLNEQGWVIDFGGLKDIRLMLESMLDHKLIVAEDDPEITTFRFLHEKQIADIVFIDEFSLERLAELIADKVQNWLLMQELPNFVNVFCVEVSEHSANKAIFMPTKKYESTMPYSTEDAKCPSTITLE